MEANFNGNISIIYYIHDNCSCPFCDKELCISANFINNDVDISISCIQLDDLDIDYEELITLEYEYDYVEDKNISYISYMDDDLDFKLLTYFLKIIKAPQYEKKEDRNKCFAL